MATDDAMDVESATQGLYGMDVEHQPAPEPAPPPAPAAPPAPPPEPPVSPAVAESILVARRGVLSFLRERRAEDIVPHNSRVVMVDSNVGLRLAFRALLENGVRAAPVIDTETHEFCGMLSVSDVVDSLMHQYYSHPPEELHHDLSDGLNEYTVRTWRQQRDTAGEGASSGTEPPFRCVDANAPLFEAVRLMRDARMLHLPILGRDHTLLHTLEHWRVLRFLHRHFAAVTAPHAAGTTAPAADPQRATQLFSLPLSQLSLGTYANLVTVGASTPLLRCLQTLQQHALAAVPVVDARNQLIEVYSRADAAVLAGGRCDGTLLEQPVGEVLRGVRGGAPFVGATCERSEMLGTVFERFECTGVQRLYVAGEAGLEGVVSLSDLLQYFLQGY